jgi:tetratricopeptide (TPR) repeat protein
VNARLLAAILAVAAVVTAVVATVCGIYLSGKDRQQLPPPEVPGQGRLEVIEAFQNRPAEAAPKDFEQFFADFGKCLRAGGGGGNQYWDVARFAREVDRDGALRRAGLQPDNPSFLLGLRGGLAQSMMHLSQAIRYDETEVRAVRWLIPGREAVVITRHTVHQEDEVFRFKMRWWLVNDRGWRVYDIEDVSMGGRVTAESGSVVAELAAGGRFARDRALALQPRIRKFQQAQSALLDGEFDNAERILADPDLAGLPQTLKPVIALWRAIAACRLNKVPEAHRFLDEAERGLPDSPAVFLVRAECHATAEEWDKVLVAGRKYVELIGADEEICIHMGNAFAGLGQHAEAAAEYRKALDDIPDSVGALSGLIVCIRPDDRAELGERFARFKNPSKHLAELIAQAGEDDEACAILVAVVRDKAPNDPEALFQAGRLQLRKNELPEAVRLFLRAIEQGGEQRARFLGRFAWEMAERGKAIEAYQALPDADAEAGFKSLAEALEDDPEENFEKRLKPLESLIDVHRKRKPMDVWIAYYEGVLHNGRRQFDRAEKALAVGMGRDLDPESRERFRWLRVQNLAEAGREVEAYLKVAPRRETFSQLADRMYEDTQLPLLAALVWMHGWIDPADPALPLRRGDLCFWTGKYAEAIAEFRLYRSRTTGKNGLAYEWRVKDQTVRSLLRLNRLDEARAELRPADGKSYYNRVLDAAITAASGDVARTERELEELIKSNLATPASFHADPDLSAALKTEPFKKLLQKYPPPKIDGPGFKKT